MLVGCGAAPHPAPVPVANVAAVHSCREAAAGIERATRDVRAPETSVVRAMDARCEDDRWEGVAIECFATMHEGELARCAKLLGDGSRGAMLAEISGGGGRAAIEVARVRLGQLALGVGECDRFVAAVTTVLGCEQMPLDARVELGNETSEMWDLPTQGLPEDAQRRMAEACGVSLRELQTEAANAGCTL